jgi:TonB family protein
MVSFRAPVLPWAGSVQDDVRFQRIWRAVLVACALLCLVVLLVPVVGPDRTQVQELPPRLATMILENVKLPPPPKTVPEALSRPEAPAPETLKPEPPRKVAANMEALVPEARVPVPNKLPGEMDAARRKAAGVGLLAMSKDLAEMHGAPMAVQLAPVKQGPGVGTGIGVGVGAGNEAGLPARALITSNATGGSGGINTAGYSRNTGGGGLAGRSTTLVEGVAGGGGGGGAGGGGARGRGDGTGSGVGGAGGTVQRGASGKASRSIEEIKLVFERNKGAIYAIYNRALREEPGLQGKVVLELKIAPAGHVVECRIVSSELKAPDLESKLLARIRQFDFGAKEVDLMVVTWPVDFLPS